MNNTVTKMELTVQQHRYLATVCGGIYHCWTTYNDKEVEGRDLEFINSFFKTKNEHFSISRVEPFTMRLESEKAVLDYIHDSNTIEKRVLTVLLKH